MIYYTVYQTTNLINNKIYIGVHKTTNPNDNYLGSGYGLLKAVKKYGKDNFKKECLAVYDNSIDMFEHEAKLVNEEFIKRSDTYNRKIGGYGGWTHICNNKDLNDKRLTLLREYYKVNEKERIKKECLTCNSSFFTKKGKFCSRSCAAIYNNSKRKDNKLWFNTNCAECNKPLHKYQYEINLYPRHFCNKSCSCKFTRKNIARSSQPSS